MLGNSNIEFSKPKNRFGLQSRLQFWAVLALILALTPGQTVAQITSSNTSPAVSGGAGATVNENADIVIGSGGNGTVTVDGVGTTLNATENGVSPTEDGLIIVGGDGGTGDLNIQNNGTVNITADGVGSTDAHLRISDGSFGSSQQGTVTLNNGTLNLSSENETSLLGVGRRGHGVINATNSTINLSTASAVDSSVLHVGGSSSIDGDAGTFGEVTLTNTTLTLSNTNASGTGANSISVGRNTNSAIAEGSRPLNTLVVQSGSTITLSAIPTFGVPRVGDDLRSGRRSKQNR